MKTIGCIGHDGDCCKTRDEDLKDAERWRWIAEYLPSDRLEHDDAIVACENKEQLDAVIDAAIRARNVGEPE